jgi:hypothetical protein
VISNVSGIVKKGDPNYYGRGFICPNGIDYGYIERDLSGAFSLYKNDEKLISRTYFSHIMFNGSGTLYFAYPEFTTGGANSYKNLVIKDDTSKLIVPTGIYSEENNLKFWFDSSGRLLIRNDNDPSFITLRREGQFSSEEGFIQDQDELLAYRKEHSLFSIETITSGFSTEPIQQKCIIYKDGQVFSHEQIITDFSFNRNGDSITYSAYNLSNNTILDEIDNTDYIAHDGSLGLDYKIDFTIKKDKKKLFKAKLMKIVSLAGMLQKSVWELGKPIFTKYGLTESGLVSRLCFTGNTDVLMKMNMPVSEENDSKKTTFKRVGYKSFIFITKHRISFRNSGRESYFQLNKQRIDGMKDFRLFENQDELPEGCFVLIDNDGAEYIVFKKEIIKTPHTGVLSACPQENGDIDIYVLDDQRVRCLSFKSEEKPQKQSDNSSLSLPGIDQLKIYTQKIDSDGIYLSTDRGLYFSFDNGKNWEHFSGTEVQPLPDLKDMKRFIVHGKSGYMISNKKLWTTRNLQEWSLVQLPYAVWNINESEDYLYIKENNGPIYRTNIDDPVFSQMELVSLYNDGEPIGDNPDRITPDISRALNHKGIEWVLDINLGEINYENEGQWVLFPFSPSGDPRQSDIKDFGFIDETMYIGTSNGIFLTEDRGRTWSKKDISTGLSGNSTKNIVNGNGRLFALTGTTVITKIPNERTRFKFSGFPYIYRFGRESALEYELGEELFGFSHESGAHSYRELGTYCGLSYSDDGGMTWEHQLFSDLTGIDEKTFWARVLIYDDGNIYLSDGVGIYKSDARNIALEQLPPRPTGPIMDMAVMNQVLYIKVYEENRYRYYYLDDNWKELTVKAEEKYKGEICKKIKSDSEFIYVYPKNNSPMKYSKQNRIWSSID